MSKQANPVAIGGFVLGALGLIVAGILIFSSGALFQEKRQLVTYFPGTVQGLSVGAGVEFHGVKIGQVKQIRLDVWPQENRFRIPVFYEVWPDSLRVFGTLWDDPREGFRALVEKRGLRARLESVSLVTGQYIISLGLHPDTEIHYRGEDEAAIEIPAIKSTRDHLSGLLQNLELDELVNTATGALGAIKTLIDEPALKSLVVNADAAAADARQLIASIDAGVNPLLHRADTMLGDYSTLARTASERVITLADSIESTVAEIDALSRNISQEVKPISNSAVGAFNKAGKAMHAVDGLVGEQSASRYDLGLLLKEAAGAARSLRLLADYLQQNPDALLKGKF